MLKIISDKEPTSQSLSEIEEEERPKEPEGGIPRQWLPGFVRWPLRLFLLPIILIDLAAQRVARWLIPPPFKRMGKCLRRGNCCYSILLPETKGILGRVFYFWNTQVLGFYRQDGLVYESEGKRVYVMGCRYLQKDGSCKHYALRPVVCRKWPMIEYFGVPRIIKGCGFKAVLRK